MVKCSCVIVFLGEDLVGGVEVREMEGGEGEEFLEKELMFER